MINRRKMIGFLSSLPFIGGFWSMGGVKSVNAANIASNFYRDYFQELGVRTFINATGTYTYLTGSLMRPEVLQAINYASHKYVDLNELQDKVGGRIAELLHCDAAMVTAGAASALTLGTTATITGTDPEKIKTIPDLPGPRREVIVQKNHRYGYDHGVRNTGVKMVEVGSKSELEAAINENTTMMLFLNHKNNDSVIKDEEFVALGKKHGIPTFTDCAADVPPVENLWKYTDMGFDMVTFSGGKGLRGPQSAGLLLGRKDLIEAAKLNTVPHSDSFGRGMKVNKEEMLGMMVALEEYLAMDHDKFKKDLRSRVDHIKNAVKEIPGVWTEIFIQEIGNHVPQLRLNWDQNKIKATPDEVRERLRQGHPSIETIVLDWRDGDLFVNIWMANPGEERIVARRLREELINASS